MEGHLFFIGWSFHREGARVHQRPAERTSAGASSRPGRATAAPPVPAAELPAALVPLVRRCQLQRPQHPCHSHPFGRARRRTRTSNPVCCQQRRLPGLAHRSHSCPQRTNLPWLLPVPAVLMLDCRRYPSPGVTAARSGQQDINAAKPVIFLRTDPPRIRIRLRYSNFAACATSVGVQ
jgi:hypothetical protein